jgi:hypothetical protein
MAFKVRGTDLVPSNLRRSLNRTSLNNDDSALYDLLENAITILENDKRLINDKLGKTDKIKATEQIDGIVPISNGGSISGIYNPITANVANVTGLEWDVFQYIRIGDFVHVSGKVRFNTVTAIGVDTRIAISLPILSYFDFDFQCSGVGYSAEVNQGAAIEADVVNSRAELRFLSSTNGAFDMNLYFDYRIIAQ